MFMKLLQARDILELGLRNVAYARKASAQQDGKGIADVSWAKVCQFFANSNPSN
jgi:hypothetical protein